MSKDKKPKSSEQPDAEAACRQAVLVELGIEPNTSSAEELWQQAESQGSSWALLMKAERAVKEKGEDSALKDPAVSQCLMLNQPPPSLKIKYLYQKTPPVWHDQAVLVIDDDPDIVDVLKEALDGLPFRFLCAYHPNTAKKILADNQDISLVFLDFQLPSTNGFQFYLGLKAQGRITADLQVVMVTGVAKPELVKQGIEIGLGRWFVKPFNTDEIRDFANSVLESKAS